MIDRVYEEGEIQNINYEIDVQGKKRHFVANARLFPYNGKKCVAWSARDFTTLKEYEARISDQTRKLKKIAFYQSHKVRGPLSNILGVTNLLKALKYKDIDPTMIEYLVASAEELDQVLHLTVDETIDMHLKNVPDTK